MQRPVALLLIMLVIATMAYFTKPSDNQCIEKAKQEFQNVMLGNVYVANPQRINRSLLNETLTKAFMESLRVQDRFLYKEINRQRGNKKVRIGWGAFGYVSVDVK